MSEGLRRSGRSTVKKHESVAENDSGSNSPNVDMEYLSLDDSNSNDGRRKKKLSKTEKALRTLKSKEDNNSTFMADFNPTQSRREKQKATRKPYSASNTKKSNIYDEKGLLIQDHKDLCDCLEDTCPGCHFPCPKCRSNKCGHECRQNRKWQYDTVEIDGVTGSLRTNNNLVALTAK